MLFKIKWIIYGSFYDIKYVTIFDYLKAIQQYA